MEFCVRSTQPSGTDRQTDSTGVTTSIANDEMQRLWQDADMVYFKILSHNFSEWAEEAHDNTKQKG
jgi:hypothetical protein